MKFHKLLHLTRDVTGQHYLPVPSDVSLPRLIERRRRLKFRLSLVTLCRLLFRQRFCAAVVLSYTLVKITMKELYTGTVRQRQENLTVHKYIYRRFSKTCSKDTRMSPKILRKSPKIVEGFRIRGRPKDVSIIHQRI